MAYLALPAGVGGREHTDRSTRGTSGIPSTHRAPLTSPRNPVPNLLRPSLDCNASLNPLALVAQPKACCLGGALYVCGR